MLLTRKVNRWALNNICFFLHFQHTARLRRPDIQIPSWPCSSPSGWRVETNPCVGQASNLPWE